ncbi:MAG: addiction module protein [Pirellulales bacterium]|nr:addiction module protein [Pirellulales bacterium]
MTTVEQILEQALALSVADRLALIEKLDLSIPAEGSHPEVENTGSAEFATPELAAKWNDEVERRLGAYDRGEVQAIDADVVLAELRARLATKMAEKRAS